LKVSLMCTALIYRHKSNIAKLPAGTSTPFIVPQQARRRSHRQFA